MRNVNTVLFVLCGCCVYRESGSKVLMVCSELRQQFAGLMVYLSSIYNWYKYTGTTELITHSIIACCSTTP